MRQHTRLHCILVCAFYLAILPAGSRPGSAFAAEDLDSLIAHAPGLEAYPQASAITLLDRTEVTLDDKGHKFSRREFLIKLLDERAKDTFGDQSIRFDADEDTVIIETARTRLPDGSWIVPEKDAYTLTSAPEVQWASAYSQAKQQNISFPGMDVGAAIHLVYRIEPKRMDKPVKDPQSGGVVLFGGYEPVRQKSLKIRATAARPVQFEMQNSNVKPLITKTGDVTEYVWEFRDQPQITEEPNSVGLADLVPRLLWTTFPGWEALGTYVAERFWEKVDSCQIAVKGFSALSDPRLQGKPVLMNTSLWVVRNLRNVNLPLGRVGYEPNSADRVWQNKYGDPRDKAVLLTALLRSSGFGPLPVLVLNTAAPFCSLPVLEQFTHVILAVPTGQDTLWIDPTAEHYVPGVLPFSCTYGMGCLLSAGAPILLQVPAETGESRSVQTELRGQLAANGDFVGSASCAPMADFAARARAIFKDQKPLERDMYAQRAASRLGQGTTVTSFTVGDAADLTTRFAARLEFNSPEVAVRQGDLLLFELPSNPFEFGVSGFYPSLPEVKYPVRLPAQGQSKMVVNVALPESCTVAYLPPPLVIDNRYVHLELSAHPSSGSLIWEQTVEIRANQVPVGDYPDVREAYRRFALPKSRLAILEHQ